MMRRGVLGVVLVLKQALLVLLYSEPAGASRLERAQWCPSHLLRLLLLGKRLL